MDISGAAEIPVTKLFGRSPSGLNATGESDLQNYYDMIAEKQEAVLRPILNKVLPPFIISTIGSLPEDFDFDFDTVAEPTDKERADLAKCGTDNVVAAYNAGLISQRTALQELKQQSERTGVWTNITDEDIERASDTVEQPGEMGGMFGGEESLEKHVLNQHTRILGFLPCLIPYAFKRGFRERKHSRHNAPPLGVVGRKRFAPELYPGSRFAQQSGTVADDRCAEDGTILPGRLFSSFDGGDTMQSISQRTQFGIRQFGHGIDNGAKTGVVNGYQVRQRTTAESRTADFTVLDGGTGDGNIYEGSTLHKIDRTTIGSHTSLLQKFPVRALVQCHTSQHRH